MALDISSMSEKELVKLKVNIDDEMKRREKSKLEDARKAAEDAAKKHGFSLSELMGDGKKASKKTIAAPKFRNPENPDQTWSGRGRQPSWYKDAVDAGKSPDSMAI